MGADFIVDFLMIIGQSMSELIFWSASFLTRPEAPGLVSIALLVGLLVATILLLASARQKLSTLLWIEGLVKESKAEEDFTAQAPRIDSEVSARRPQTRYAHIAAAWAEFRETLVLDETSSPPVLRNSVRPSSFFNLEDLHYGPGFYRYLPGLFVSIGLFLTFLGLISALQAIGSGLSIDATPEEMRDALNDLLGAASAKFIMSLTGLFASIVFTVVLRASMGRVEQSVHRFCGLLEERLSFVSLEGVAMRQLAIARGQEDSFKRIGLELVEKLGEPLRKEVPETIAQSIGTAMAPLLEHIGKAGTDGVNRMVTDLSSQIARDVQMALSEASTQLSAAAEKISYLSEKMDESSGRMGREMETSVNLLARSVEELTSHLSKAAETTNGTLSTGADRLLAIMNDTLDGIRRNTAEGADALKDAAAKMQASADSFKERLDEAAESGSNAVRDRMKDAGTKVGSAVEQAGRGIIDSINLTEKDLLDASHAFREKLREDLVEPITGLVKELDTISERLKEGSGQLTIASGYFRQSGESAQNASNTLATASRDLQAASTPLRGSVDRIEKAVSGLAQSTQHASETVMRSAKETAESTARILDAAKVALGGEQKALAATLGQLTQLLVRIENQRERVDKMDEMLGRAFDDFTRHVQSAVETLSSHVQAMNQELAPAIDKMHEIVDRAETFIPESRPRR
jgi:ABC-type transporter Mla subunit MlaD